MNRNGELSKVARADRPRRLRRVAAACALGSICACTTVWAAASRPAAPAADHSSEEETSVLSASLLQTVLVSPAPRPEVASELAPFAPLIGSWDVEIVFHDENGGRRTVSGEWHFGWGLDGRALLDVWIAPRRELRDGPMPVSGEWGLTVRFYDPSIDALRSVWHGPKNHVVMPFVGRAIGEEIVLEGSFEPGVSTRWIFSDIGPDHFRWRNVDSRDSWKTEKLTQEMFATRRSGDK